MGGEGRGGRVNELTIVIRFLSQIIVNLSGMVGKPFVIGFC